MTIKEGRMPFMGYSTYYRIVGEPSGRPPLLLLHGGPGSTHNYFEVLDRVAGETGRQVISYDQIGCGESYLDGHPELWASEQHRMIALMEGARHMCFVDRHEDYCRILEPWLEEHD